MTDKKQQRELATTAKVSTLAEQMAMLEGTTAELSIVYGHLDMLPIFNNRTSERSRSIKTRQKLGDIEVETKVLQASALIENDDGTKREQLPGLIEKRVLRALRIIALNHQKPTFADNADENTVNHENVPKVLSFTTTLYKIRQVLSDKFGVKTETKRIREALRILASSTLNIQMQAFKNGRSTKAYGMGRSGIEIIEPLITTNMSYKTEGDVDNQDANVSFRLHSLMTKHITEDLYHLATLEDYKQLKSDLAWLLFDKIMVRYNYAASDKSYHCMINELLAECGHKAFEDVLDDRIARSKLKKMITKTIESIKKTSLIGADGSIEIEEIETKLPTGYKTVIDMKIVIQAGKKHIDALKATNSIKKDIKNEFKQTLLDL